MGAIIAFLVELLRCFLPAIVEQSRGSVEDGAVNRDVKESLQSSVRKRWGNVKLPFLFAGLLLVSGCFVRTIYVPAGEPVRLRETVKDVDVWVLDANGVPVASEMDLPEGWYVLPLEQDDGKSNP